MFIVNTIIAFDVKWIKGFSLSIFIVKGQDEIYLARETGRIKVGDAIIIV